MVKIICDRFSKIIKNKSSLEKNLSIKISNKGREINIYGKPEDEYVAEAVISAIEFGFPISKAIMIKSMGYMFGSINIKDYTKRKNLNIIRGRIIGKRGKVLRTLCTLTDCFFEIKENKVGIIGDPDNIKNAQEAIISLIKGAKHSNVYSYLEKHRVQPVFDFGLKEKSKRYSTHE
ncbi:MAG: KH domain-containing protein [Candidatus Pacearchaeota archaeon]